MAVSQGAVRNGFGHAISTFTVVDGMSYARLSGGAGLMPEYRLYCLNEQGGFSRSHEIPAGHDADAIARAKAMKLPVKCELWERARLVAQLPAHAGR
jgi:hypothetical protein